jgi:hypothetical protein
MRSIGILFRVGSIAVLCWVLALPVFSAVRSAKTLRDWPSFSDVNNLNSCNYTALILFGSSYPTLNQVGTINKFRGILQLVELAGPPRNSQEASAVDTFGGPITILSGLYPNTDDVLRLNQLARHPNFPLYLFVSSYPSLAQVRILRELKRGVLYIVVTGTYPTRNDVVICNQIAGLHLVINTTALPSMVNARDLNALTVATTLYVDNFTIPNPMQIPNFAAINTGINLYQTRAFTRQVLQESILLSYETNK